MHTVANNTNNRMWEFNITISDIETNKSSFYLITAQKFVQTSMTLTNSNQNFNGDTKNKTNSCIRNIDNRTKNYTKLIKVIIQLISDYNNRCGCN